MLEVNFPLTEEGKLRFAGHANLDVLLQLGTLLHTKQLNSAAQRYELQTDQEGLRVISGALDGAKEGLSNLVECIGLLMGHMEPEEIPSNVLCTLGYSLVALAGFQRDMETLDNIVASQMEVQP